MERKALVIGGGIAGIKAAQKIAAGGVPVVLVEKEAQLGGHMRDLSMTFPRLQDAGLMLRQELDAVEADPRVSILTGFQLKELNGQAGNFEAVLEGPNGSHRETVSAVVVATGFRYFEPSAYTEYGYARVKSVLTSLELEKILQKGQLSQYLGDAAARPVVALVHCVGSRDRAKGYRYCSKICCSYCAKEAILIKQQIPKAQVFVFYIDIRALGKGYEELVRSAIEEYGVRYIRGRVAKVVPNGDKLTVRAEDSLIGNPVELEADLVVLASAMEPGPDSRQLAQKLDLAVDEYGFFQEADYNTEPVRSSRPGIYLAGSCLAPMEISQAVAQAGSAAAEVLGYLAGQK